MNTTHVSPLRIGFVDFQLENFHANTFLDAIRHRLPDLNAQVAGCTALDADAGRQWAQKNQVPWFNSSKAMAKEVDAWMVLAPSDPQLHFKLVKQVAPWGKPIYLDKPAAPNRRTLQRIFDLADQYRVPLQTTSALRYTAVQEEVAKMPPGTLDHIITWGSGRSFEEYGIHPVEMAVSCMGADAQSLLCRQNGKLWQLLVNYPNGRSATIHLAVDTSVPFSATLIANGKATTITPPTSRLFIDTAQAIIQFLRSGQPNIPRQESLAIMGILDAAQRPTAKRGFVKIA